MQHGFIAAKMVRLIGGAVVLDFVNTCNGRRPDTSLDQAQERLTSFGFFFEWAQHSGLITLAEHATWLPLVAGPQESLTPLLDAIKEFREDLFILFYARSQGRPINERTLYPLNAVLQRTMPLRFLTVEGGIPSWAWRPCLSAQDIAGVLLGRLANSAQELLTGPDLMHLKCCSSSECDWLFLDSSKNKQRRWCQMSVCGSREKLHRIKKITG